MKLRSIRFYLQLTLRLMMENKKSSMLQRAIYIYMYNSDEV